MRDRDAILERRRRLVAAALACVAPGLGCAGTNAPPPRDGHSTRSAPAQPNARTEAKLVAAADTDADGIEDARDACPEVPGIEAIDPVHRGCPPTPCLSVLPPGEVRITLQVYFAARSSDLSQGSEAVLDSLAQHLFRVPELKLTIVGHSVPSEPADLALRRAESVLRALVERGVDRSRLNTKSVGSSQPVEAHSTEAGRQRNRRVEFLPQGTE